MTALRKTGRLLLASYSAVAVGNASAQAVATCSDPEGHAYYHYAGLLSKSQSGFEKDKITAGLTTLQRLDNGEYDLLIVDIRKQVISYRNDGGRVILLRRGMNDATFLVIFPGKVIELYTFYVDSAGAKRFDLLQSKGGDAMTIHKSSLMTGVCSRLDLSAVKPPAN